MGNVFKLVKCENGLCEVHLQRFIRSEAPKPPFICVPFMDENLKHTTAKYKAIGVDKGGHSDVMIYVWKLDGRSVRYMKRVKIIEGA